MKQVELNFLLTTTQGGNPKQFVFAFILLYALELPFSSLTYDCILYNFKLYKFKSHKFKITIHIKPSFCKKQAKLVESRKS